MESLQFWSWRTEGGRSDAGTVSLSKPEKRRCLDRVWAPGAELAIGKPHVATLWKSVGPLGRNGQEII